MGDNSRTLTVRPDRVSSCACASAKTRTTEAPPLASPLGSELVTLGAAGQMISTSGGLSAGLISSTRSVSPLGVIWLAANSMRDDGITAGSFRSRPCREGYVSWRALLLLWVLILPWWPQHGRNIAI